MSRRLVNSVRWAKGDPIMKLTALRDMAKQAEYFLDVIDYRKEVVSTKGNDTDADGTKDDGWKLFGSGGKASEDVEEANRVKLPAPCANELRLATPAVCYSTLMSLHHWVYALNDVQDLFCRGRQPTAPDVRRLRYNMEVDVYPTRNVERVVDGSSTCTLQVSADILQQTAQPFIHDSTLDEALKRQDKPKMGAEDEMKKKGSKRTTVIKPRIAAKQQKLSGKATEHLSQSSISSKSRSNNGLLSLPNYQQMCETKHGGRIASEKIRIDLPTKVRSDLDIRDTLVLAHSAILSALYINGHAVEFYTSSELVEFYVRTLMQHLVQDEIVSITLVSKENETETTAPQASYVLDSQRSAVWFVCTGTEAKGLPSATWARQDVEKVGQYIAENLPRTVVVDTNWSQFKELKDNVEGQLVKRFGEAVGTKAIEWMSLDTLTGASGLAAPSSEGNETLSAVGALLHAPFITVMTSGPIQKSTRFHRFVRREAGLGGAMAVGVNCNAMDALLQYPQSISVNRRDLLGGINSRVPFLGGCYRYEDVERCIVSKPLHSTPLSWMPAKISNAISATGHFNGMGGGIAVDDMQLLRATATGEVTEHDVRHTKCRNILLMERAMDYMASPRLVTFIPLVSARLFGI